MFKRMKLAPGWRIRALAAALWLPFGQSGLAQAIEITAEYRAGQSSDEFRNTTPNSGYCVEYSCTDGVFSVALPINYERTVLSGLPPVPQRWSVQTPREATVNVVSDRGDTAALKLQITHVAEVLTEGSSPLGRLDNPAAHHSAGGGCTWVAGEIVDGGRTEAGFVWRVDDPRSPSVCYPETSYTGDQNMITPLARSFSVGYKLILPKAYTMPMGTYNGSVTFSVGETGDFALGSNLAALSTNSVTFNFTLTVHHELQVQFPANSHRVLLEPTTGWQKWLDTGVNPTMLKGTLPFRITTSGPFSVIMTCGETTGTSSCGMRNRRTNDYSEFLVFLQPPKGAEDANRPGVQAPRRVMTSQNPIPFRTNGVLRSSLGSFSFELFGEPRMGNLLKEPGDEWSGLVTLVFDATL